MAKKKKPTDKAEEFFTMRIKSSQKGLWENFIRSSNKRFTKLSQLVRYCVNGYINGYLVENTDQNNSQLKRLLNEKKILYDDEISKLNKTMSDMMDLLLTQVVEPNKTIEGEEIEFRLLTALKKANYNSKELSITCKLKHEAVIPHLTSLIKEGSIGRNDNNEYFYIKKEE